MTTSFSVLKETITDAGWYLLWASFVFGSIYAIYDFRETLNEIRNAPTRRARASALLKMSLLLALPIVGILSALSGQWGSERSDLALKKVRSIAEANDLKNLPVSDISGTVNVEVAGRLGEHPTMFAGIDFESYVILMESNSPPNTLSFGAFQALYVTGTVGAHETTSTGPTTHGYSMNLRRDLGASGSVVVIRDGSPATSGIVMDRVNWVQLKLHFVPPQSEVLSGTAEILINGIFKKAFSIPAQICSSNGFFYGTNSPN